MTANIHSEEALIREARLRSNAAIGRHDVDALSSFWTEDIHVTGSTSRQISGIEANRRFYLEQFAKRSDTLWVRTPTTVQVMPAWNVAMESGDWVGTWTDADGPVKVSGRYMAQWLRAAGQWRIHSELFAPTDCEGGAYCERHPVRKQDKGRP